MRSQKFDILIENPICIKNSNVSSLGQLLFKSNTRINDNSSVILSHIENEYVELNGSKLRSIVLQLIKRFKEKDINKGQTVLLLSYTGCNEMYTAISFIALATMGCRVFMPMYIETKEFSEWIEITDASHMIYPETEVVCLEGHQKEKSDINKIKEIAKNKGLKIWDNLKDLNFIDLIKQEKNELVNKENQDLELCDVVSHEEETLIVTTSGTTGKSKLLTYTHEAFFLNCLSWEQAGFYKDEILGGIGFTPLFTHTMGIRSFINALCTGTPVCLIITEWFVQKPEIVRYLLLKMKPNHITGGPSIYNLLIELFRTFPELKSELSKHLKSLVSSGAAYNPITSNEISAAIGLPLHNAYGTTETQQISSTLLSKDLFTGNELMPMGKPLPGVSIGLMKNDTGKDHYRLFVKSVFGYKRCLNEPNNQCSDYFDTGDIVILDKNEELYYYGRESSDFIKDSFGVKIPILLLKQYYNDLIKVVLHMELYPIINFPGISALLFVDEKDLEEGIITDSRVLKKYAGIVEGINNRLMDSIEIFEYQHRHICRIAIVNKKPPLTSKGTVSSKNILSLFSLLIDGLTDTRKDIAGVEITDKLYQITEKYTRYISPQIGTMMAALKIDVSYHKGFKDSLFTYKNGEEIEVLDLVGGYGTNFTGHNNEKIIKAATDFISSGKLALSNQASIQQITGLLAEKLNLIFGPETGKSFQVTFANSGSEAVEIALHHAFFEWKKKIEKYRDQQLQLYGCEKDLNVEKVWKKNMQILDHARIKVIALSNSFHGQSTGARSVLGNEKKRKYFSAFNNIEPLFVNYESHNWQEVLDSYLKNSGITLQKISREDGILKVVYYKVNSIIAAIAEPIIGEGGVREVNTDLLNQLSCHDFPLISDEIQCGLGRTGNIPEFKKAHYYILGKTLGGGIEKISAVLIDNTRFCLEFSEYYVSTFGNGELAAHIALKTIELIENENLSALAINAGKYLKEKLNEICSQYPSIISRVEGKGLMQAIYFNPDCAINSIFLRILFQSEKAGYLFSAWFLNNYKIRILPTLSATNVLRIEPSAFLTKEEAGRFCNALVDLCKILQEARLYDLFSFMMNYDPFYDKNSSTEANEYLDYYNPVLEKPAEGAIKVAFIGHFVFPIKEFKMLEPDFKRASDTGLRLMYNSLQLLLEMKPIYLLAENLFNNKVHFSFYIIPVDSAELEFLHKSGQRRVVVSKIQEAVNMASANGAKIISLGGYTSILTNNGLSLTEPDESRIITGNTLTAASGLKHLGKVIRKNPLFKKRNTIAIVGSTGNIGRIIAQLILEQEDICKELLLVSRTEKRQAEFMNELMAIGNSKIKISSSINMTELKKADIIVICTNTNDPILFPHHISTDKPILISDLSVPSAVAEGVKLLPNVEVMPFSAYVSLAKDKDVVISSYSPPGTVFCCAGESILLALESCSEPLKGRIVPEAVKSITKLASKWGFFDTIDSLKSYKSSIS